MKRLGKRGFTIVELMIATSVLAVLLLVASSIFIAIGNLYTKGVGGTRLQDNVRGVMENIGGTIQFSNQDVTPATSMNIDGVTTQAYCAGGQRYSFTYDMIPGTSVGGGYKLQYVMWQDSAKLGKAGCAPVNLTSNPAPARPAGQSIGTADEAIHNFAISNVGPGLWNITIDAYASPGNDLVNLTSPTQATCKGTVGEQFCTTAQLSTTVQRRLSSGSDD